MPVEVLVPEVVMIKGSVLQLSLVVLQLYLVILLVILELDILESVIL